MSIWEVRQFIESHIPWWAIPTYLMVFALIMAIYWKIVFWLDAKRSQKYKKWAQK